MPQHPSLNPAMPPESLPDSLGDDPAAPGYPQAHPDAHLYKGVLPARVYPDIAINYAHAGIWHTLHPKQTPLTVAAGATVTTTVLGPARFVHLVYAAAAIAWTTTGGDAGKLTSRYPLRVSIRHQASSFGQSFITNDATTLVPLWHLFGTGRRWHRWPRPAVIPTSGTLVIRVNNPTAVEVKVHMAFVARRRTPMRFRKSD